MTKLVFLALLKYLDASGDSLTCQAVVICDPGQPSCHVHPIESCPGNYDPKRAEPLSGKWNMGQCLTAQLVNGDRTADVLGCATDMHSVDVDREQVKP